MGYETISAAEALDFLSPEKSPSNNLEVKKQNNVFLDVRSPGEFSEASVPGFTNLPILNNEERHEVGLTYKNKGQSKAVELALQLVEPHKTARVESWLRLGNPIVVTCWRGGLRSRTACEWLKENGRADLSVKQVIGGYKQMRALLLESLEQIPQFLVLSGLTGSGKTKLLKEINVNKVDLEGLANHRGSSFGRQFNSHQPSQATFENSLGLFFRNKKAEIFLVEDESRGIGSVYLPNAVKQQIVDSPVVFLESSIPERVKNIFEEYLVGPSLMNVDTATIGASMTQATQRIEKKLGGALTKEVIAKIQLAFELQIQKFGAKTISKDSLDLHHEWIEILLVEYYDKLYKFSLERHNRSFVFKGDYSQCLKWIPTRFNSPKQ